MKEDKGEQLRPCQVRKNIDSILFDEFFDCFSCMEEDLVWWSFNMKDFVNKETGGLRIETEKKYAVFTSIISKPDAERRVYLRLANSEKDSEDDEKKLLV